MDKKWYETEKHKMVEKAAKDFRNMTQSMSGNQAEMEELLLIVKDYVIEKANIYKDLTYLSPDSILFRMNNLRSIVWSWFNPKEMTSEERESILLGGHDTVEDSFRQMALDILLGESRGLSSGFLNGFLTKEQANEFIRYVYEGWEYFVENNLELYGDVNVDFHKKVFSVWISTLAPLTEETIVKYREHLNIKLIEGNVFADRTPSVDLLIDKENRE